MVKVLSPVYHLQVINNVWGSENVWESENVRHDDSEVCADGVSQFFHVPQSANRLQFEASDKPTRHSHRVRMSPLSFIRLPDVDRNKRLQYLVRGTRKTWQELLCNAGLGGSYFYVRCLYWKE